MRVEVETDGYFGLIYWIDTTTVGVARVKDKDLMLYKCKTSAKCNVRVSAKDDSGVSALEGRRYR
jgi:hypothetical protein